MVKISHIDPTGTIPSKESKGDIDMIYDHLRAGYPALCVLTQEPDRAERLLVHEGWDFFTWDCIRGIRNTGKPTVVDEERDPVAAVKWLDGHPDAVLIAHNLHLFLDIPEVIQAIQNGVPRWKSIGTCLVMVSPVIKMVPEVEKLFTLIDLPLPGEETLLKLQEELAESVQIETDPDTALAARGLTEFEAETAFALSLIKDGKFSSRIVTEAKAQMIRKSGLLEFWEPAAISDIGGLDNLKGYIANRARAFQKGYEHLPRPKGILLVGIPGTGKSLSCKAAASILGRPLIRLDIGALKNSLVGESERRMRQATQVIDAFGEAVIWLEEIEKVFAHKTGESDGGTTAGMLAHFLVWLQETSTPVLVMATANDISKLPPEFIRSGRFDAVFFVDLPNLQEKIEIIRIMNHRYGCAIPEETAEKLNGYSGAEIEQIARDSLFDGLDAALSSLVPLSKVMKEEIHALRNWAQCRARLANGAEEVPGESRKIRTMN